MTQPHSYAEVFSHMIAISIIYSYVEKYRCVIDTAIYTAVSKVRTFDNFSAKLKRNSKQFQNVNYCSSSDEVSWGGGGEQKRVKHKMIFFTQFAIHLTTVGKRLPVLKLLRVDEMRKVPRNSRQDIRKALGT